jgi:rubrerythrin
MQDTTKNHDAWIAKVCDQLNKLIQLDVDAACTYREAILHVDDPVVREDLHAFLRDHERHVMDLTAVVRALGGTPIEPERDFKGRLLEGMTRLRSRSTLGALRAMRMNEKLTNRTYDKAADMYMPPIAQVSIMENLEDERRHLAAIEAHIARLTDKHEPYEVPHVRPQSTDHPYIR